jgi:molybdopterin/thiamine biosynthesis adenylyltransferase
MQHTDNHKRYERQIAMNEIGSTGQERLSSASVLIVGAGGLGSPAAFYLAAAGVGTITIIDPDRVELSNLNRQILHGVEDIGALKVQSAETSILRLNPFVKVNTSAIALTAHNASGLIKGRQVVIDALDNLNSRFILNQAAMECNVPLIHGAVKGFDGRVLTVIPGKSACLKCMHDQPMSEDTPSPVIGVTPAAIGAIQATEAVKVILGIGELLTNRLLIYEGLQMHWTTFTLSRNPRCIHCGHLQRKA